MEKPFKLTSQWIPLNQQEATRVSVALQATARLMTTRAREYREIDHPDMEEAANNCTRLAGEYSVLGEMISKARRVVLDVWQRDSKEFKAPPETKGARVRKLKLQLANENEPDPLTEIELGSLDDFEEDAA